MEAIQLDEYQLYREMAPVILTATLAFLFALTPLWQLTVVAALIGGFFCTTMKRGAFTGIIGVGSAWFLYVLMTPIHMLLNQFGALVLGSQGMGWLVLLIIFLVGGLFGFLGGSMGAGIRLLAFPPSSSTPSTN